MTDAKGGSERKLNQGDRRRVKRPKNSTTVCVASRPLTSDVLSINPEFSKQLLKHSQSFETEEKCPWRKLDPHTEYLHLSGFMMGGRRRTSRAIGASSDCTFCNAVAADPPDIPLYTTEPLTEPQRLGYVHLPGLTRGVYGSI